MASPKQFACVIINFFLLTFISYEVCTAVQLKLTNVECESLDERIIKFRECRLKVIRRGVVSLNIYIELFRPLNAIRVNAALYKKANGYRPFLYNVSADFCEFMNHSQANMLTKIGFNFIAEFSNLNHTCPYSDAFIVKNLVLTEDKFRLIPLPSGEYMVKAILTDKSQGIGMTKVYATRIE